MKTLIVLLVLCHFPVSAFAEQDLNAKQAHYSSIFARQEALHGSYRDTYLAITDINKKESLQTWYRVLLADPKALSQTNRTMNRIDDLILGKDYRMLIYYYTVTGQIQQAGQAVGLYILSAHTLLDNFAHDPQAKAQYPRETEMLSRRLPVLDIQKIDDIRDCYTNHLQGAGVTRGYALMYSTAVSEGLKKCVSHNTYSTQLIAAVRAVFEHRQYPGAPFPVSFAGYVGDNAVNLHDRIPMEPQDVLLLGEQLSLIQSALAPGMDKAYADLSIEEFKNLMQTPDDALNKLFTNAEGFRNIHNIKTFDQIGYINQTEFYGHPSFRDLNNQPGIFASMVQSIRDAKESVFIDLFWMGGSIGMNLAKELMKKTIENPNFSVIIISDNENKFNYGRQLDMIYRFMTAFSEKFPEKNFYMVPANIGIKRTALPEFVDLLITNNVVNKIHGNASLHEQLEKDGFYLLAKSDHTKAMVMDGKNPETGVAYVGSKNWTDGSGGANYDQMAEVKGPATAVILDAFYYDALEAFDLEARPSSGTRVVFNHWKTQFPEISKRKAIEAMLAPIDVINRYKGRQFNIPYVPRGEDVVAPSQNNIYGTEMSPVEQNIQAILSAKHQVLIDDQFLYDPKIVEALITAKKHHGVDVFVILESLLPYEKDASRVGAHIPNNLFIPELVANGIEVKWHTPPKSLVDAILKDSEMHPGQQISATFHVKSLSVDGVLAAEADRCSFGEEKSPEDSAPVLITGSANKDVMTMTGGFRESQVAVYAENAVTQHDCLFWSRWHDPSSTQSTDGLDFDLPPQAAAMGISEKPMFLNILRQLVFSTYNFTKDFF